MEFEPLKVYRRTETPAGAPNEQFLGNNGLATAANAIIGDPAYYKSMIDVLVSQDRQEK